MRTARLMGSLLLAGVALPCRGEVVVDRSLGGPRTVIVGPTRLIGPELGRQAGGNLFHSFSEFSIPVGESATFTGPGGVRNVIARVTGQQASVIQGPVSVAIPGANFFLINPRGVVFSDGGTIDASGAIVVTTADRLKLGKGGRFDATSPGQSVLRSAPPTAFGFLGPSPRPVRLIGSGFSGQGLLAQTGKPVSVVAGDVTMTGGATLQSFVGAVNVVSVGGPGAVVFDASRVDSAPRLDGFKALGAVVMDKGTIDASFGGQVRVRAGDVSLRNASGVIADTDVFAGGRIELAASGAMDVSGNSFVRADTTGPARGADIVLSAARARFVGVPRGRETARTAVGIDDTIAGTGTGDAGDVTLSARTVSFRDGARLASFTIAAGDGGDVTVRARSSLTIDSPNESNITGLAATTELGSTGQGGRVFVDSPVVRLLRGGEITSTTKGTGDAGDMRVRADSLLIDGFGPGPVNLNPNGLKQSQLQGRAGTGAGPGAKGGLIRVDAKTVRLTNSGVISASTFGEGDGGDVDIRTGDLLASGADPIGFAGVFARSAPAPASPPTGFGSAGSISIRATGSVVLRDGGQISVYSQTTSARSITITAGRGVSLSESRPGVTPAVEAANRPGEPTNTRITTQALNGDSGDIDISTAGPITLFNSFITAQAGQGRAGATLTLDPRSVTLNRSIIDGRAVTADVRVRITPGASLIRSTDSRILSANQATPPNLDLSGALIDLPAPVLSRDFRFLEACGLKLGPEVSSFLINGRGGMPVEPGGFGPSR